MTSSRPGTWRPLPLAESSGRPVLLVSITVGPSSYVVRVTDMANIWSENLDRKAICMRAWGENTSIDPSDTAENMTKFLSCLTAALDPNQSGHDATSLTLSPADSLEDGEDGVTLKVTCRLPGFDPLKWPILLKKQPPSSIATDLVLPILQAQSDRKQEVESLIRSIGLKDAVLTKLSDKLEAMGTGLEHVFTTLSGRKKVTRAAAEDRVKGLAPFNERRWKNELSEEAGPNTVEELVHSVFGGGGLESRFNMPLDTSPQLDKWWHDFKPTSQASQPKHTEASTSKNVPQLAPPQPANCEDDDDFQVQSTPPHLKPSTENASPKKRQLAADASAEDEGESVIPDSNPASVLSDRRRQPETKTNSSRLGAIGGRKKLVPPRSPSPSRKGNSAKQPVDDEETASEASDDDATASIPNSSPVPPPKMTAAQQKKGGIGTIGGGTMKSCPASEEKITETEVSKPKETSHRRLGMIGGKASRSVEQKKEDGERGRTTSRRANSPVEEKPRETSQDRADRKREELKRELEKKAAAGPAKKKRRF
ncbi:hypothetical protein QQS21_005312 [Conoideocrella luteorostrata]|uniref:Non-homologous end-joining factor 1 n=1 Tax=Conoideocrella luteorostrata TaxID=1105319 RepID=A0AAJ0CPL5_9HYPO|nr:hypothetical protein QQS21_005312 [Conoideocrella luteorostrata]